MTLMEHELERTVKEGDVENLINLCVKNRDHHEFFLGQENRDDKNMLHILCERREQGCIEESLNILPNQVVRKLLCQTDDQGENPFHSAAGYGNLVIAKLLVNAYNRSSDDDLSCRPWRAKNSDGQLPVEVAAHEVAAYLISVDPDHVSADAAVSLLSRGSGLTLEEIFGGGVESIIKGFDRSRIGDLVERCSDESAALPFLRQHLGLIDDNGKRGLLRTAVKRNFVRVAETILSALDISASTSSILDPTLFHLAAKRGHVDIAEFIVDEYKKSEREAASLLNQPPWRQTDRDDHKPLYHALRSKHKEFSKSILLWDLEFLFSNEDAPTAAVLEELKRIEDEPQLSNSLTTLHLEAFLQFIGRILTEDDSLVIRFLKQHLELVKLKDASGMSILHYALDKDDIPVMSLLLKTHPSVFNILDGDDDHILTRACRKHNLNAIQNIFRICPRDAIWHEDQSTVLHRVVLWDLKEYQILLSIPGISELMNKTDERRRTPLMKAILEKKRDLVQALLEQDGINVIGIRNEERKTAAEMLKENYKATGEWADLYYEMMKRHMGINLNEMRSSLLVVAALVATITFAGAFTVPGGFDQKNGDVILGRKASFILFILSDTYAMCCSMIFLYSFLWSIFADPANALLLIDRNVPMLHQSLYGTLAAFMIGVYAVVSHKSMWVAIVVCVMCGSALIFANRSTLVTIKHKFVQISRPQSSSQRKKTSRPKSSSELDEISIQR